MYVCICNAITESDVSSAEAHGAATEADVFQHFAVKPQCGTCVHFMKNMLGCRRECAVDAAGEPNCPANPRAT